MTRMIVNDKKLCSSCQHTLIMKKEGHTAAKKPHAFVPSKNKVDTIKTGLFPHTAAAAAVKNVPEPVVSCSKPTTLKDT